MFNEIKRLRNPPHCCDFQFFRGFHEKKKPEVKNADK